MSDTLNFHDVNANLKLNDDVSEAYITKTQYIPDSFLTRLADIKHESTNAPMGDFHLAAEIPIGVVEEWMADGFNIFDKNNSFVDIMKRLQSLDMDRFIATNKRLY